MNNRLIKTAINALLVSAAKTAEFKLPTIDTSKSFSQRLQGAVKNLHSQIFGGSGKDQYGQNMQQAGLVNMGPAGAYTMAKDLLHPTSPFTSIVTTPSTVMDPTTHYTSKAVDAAQAASGVYKATAAARQAAKSVRGGTGIAKAIATPVKDLALGRTAAGATGGVLAKALRRFAALDGALNLAAAPVAVATGNMTADQALNYSSADKAHMNSLSYWDAVQQSSDPRNFYRNATGIADGIANPVSVLSGGLRAAGQGLGIVDKTKAAPGAGEIQQLRTKSIQNVNDAARRNMVAWKELAAKPEEAGNFYHDEYLGGYVPTRAGFLRAYGQEDKAPYLGGFKYQDGVDDGMQGAINRTYQSYGLPTNWSPQQ